MILLREIKRIIALIIAVIIAVPAVNASAKNQTLSEQLSSDKDYGVTFEYTESDNFANIRKEYAENGYGPADTDEDIIVKAKDYESADSKIEIVKEYKGVKDAVLWKADSDYIQWKIKVPVSGIYNISMEYIASGNGIASIDRALYIDGKIPYSEASRLSFYRLFKDESKPIVNTIGDEIASDVEQYYEWQWQDFMDTDASYDGALQFYLEKGEHKLEVNFVSSNIALAKVGFTAPESILSYEEVLKEYKKGVRIVSQSYSVFRSWLTFATNKTTAPHREHIRNPSRECV